MQTEKKYLEADIKAAIITKLLNKNTAEDITVINEFTIENYSRRVDLALIKNNELHAYEVKSEYDSLRRLEGQVLKYSEYFDKITVVLSRKHIQKALHKLPSYIEVIEFDNGWLKTIHRGKKLPIKKKNSFISLMTAMELRSLASQLKIRPKTFRRKNLEVALSNVKTSTLKSAAISFIKKKYSPQYNYFLQETNGRLIKASDISSLSIHKKNIIPNPKTISVNNINDLISILDQ